MLKLCLYLSHRNTLNLKRTHPQLSWYSTCYVLWDWGKREERGRVLHLAYIKLSDIQSVLTHPCGGQHSATHPPSPFLLHSTHCRKNKRETTSHVKGKEVNKLHPVYSFFPGDTWIETASKSGLAKLFSSSQAATLTMWQGDFQHNCPCHLNSSSQIYLSLGLVLSRKSHLNRYNSI